MTTSELIEKYGIGGNCLSDAYDLGRKHERDTIVNLIEDSGSFGEFMWKLLTYYNSEVEKELNSTDVEEEE